MSIGWGGGLVEEGRGWLRKRGDWLMRGWAGRRGGAGVGVMFGDTQLRVNITSVNILAHSMSSNII